MIIQSNDFKSLLVSNNLYNKINFNFGQTLYTQKRKKQNQLAKKLRQALTPTYLQVIDTSVGGSSCGQMYRVLIQSPKFDGKSRVQQHKMVTSVLQQQLKKIHGFTLKTKVTQQMKDYIKIQRKKQEKQ